MPLSFQHPILATALRSAAALLLLSGTGLAQAQTETVETAGYLGAPDQAIDFKLPSFDTDLGTLESIDITLKYNLCAGITVDNTTGSNITFTNALLTLPITSSLPGGLDTVTTVSNGVSKGTAKPGVTVYAPERNSTYAMETVSSSSFADWEGAANAKLSLVITPGDPNAQGTGSTPGLTFTGKSTEWARLTVTYTYLATAAAPEPPGRLLSFLAGTAMLAGIGYRLRKNTCAA